MAGSCFGVCDAGVWRSEADCSGNDALSDGEDCSTFLFCAFKVFKARKCMIKQAHKERFSRPFCNSCVPSRAWTRAVVPPRLTGLAWIGSRLAHLTRPSSAPRRQTTNVASTQTVRPPLRKCSVCLIHCRWHSPNPFELRLWLGLTVPYIKSVSTRLVPVTVLFIFM